MNGAFRTTALMVLVAAATVAAAVFYYPKPAEIVVDAKVNQNLFETYETNDVRSIAIIQFSEDSNRIEQFRLRRKGERWVIPQAGDFPATRISRIGEVAKSLLDKKVLSLASDDEQAHVEYGVLDPNEADSTTVRSNIGLRVDLRDRNKADIATLIIGKAVPGVDDGVSRHYVRIPGQPAVYELEITKEIFKTRFADWIDPNLMELPPPTSQDVKIAQISVDQYRIDQQEIASAKVDPLYQLQFNIDGTQLSETFKLFKSGEFVEQQMSDAQKREASSIFQSLGNIRYIDVVGKPKAAAKALRKPTDLSDTKSLKPMEQFGFRLGKDNQFESANGKVEATTTDGVRIQLLIGSLAQRQDTETLDLQFHAMLIAELDTARFEEPKKPEGVEEDSVENKVYLRAMEEIDRKRKSAQLRIDALNKNWSKWIYIIPETVVNAIRPDITL